MAELFPTQNANNNIIDLDLSVTQKKKFRFGKDDNRILELNTSDMNIVNRISETYPKLQELQKKASRLMEGIDTDRATDDSEESMQKTIDDAATIAQRLAEVDGEMRNLIDYMFNANVSEVTAPDGSMYDPFDGSFRFEYIITLLMNQYESNLKAEFDKMEKQMNKHTAKYKR